MTATVAGEPEPAFYGPARQQQQDHVAARSQEEDARDHHEDCQEPKGLALIFGPEPHVTDGPGDEAPIFGPHRGHVCGQPVPAQRRQHCSVTARG